MVTARLGAPLAAITGRHSIMLHRAATPRQGAAATLQMNPLAAASCTSSEVVS